MLLVLPEELQKSVAAALSGDYEVSSSHNFEEISKKLSRTGDAVCAVIFDADTEPGSRVLSLAGVGSATERKAFFALTDDTGSEKARFLTEHGADILLSKPPDIELLRICLSRLQLSRSMERTKLQSSYAKLQRSDERRYREILRATGTTVFVYDAVTGNYSADIPEQHTAARFDGRPLTEIFTESGTADNAAITALKDALDTVISKGEERKSVRCRLKTLGGALRWYEVQFIKIRNSDSLTQKILIVANDVDSRVTTENTLRFRAERDPLTGLYNRETFFEKAAEMINAREAGYYVMACFDINGFKVINDRFGISRGDAILKYIGKIFEDGFDRLGGIACRVTADNFAVLYPHSLADSAMLADIREKAHTPECSPQPITFSIGRYPVEDKTLSPDAMFDRAMIAESSVKGRYDIHIAYYSEKMREKILQEQAIINEMNLSLKNGNFEIWLQPQYEHPSGKIFGAEALVRWRNPAVNEIILPGKFISLFEGNGFIYELDKFIWEHTCMILRRWLDSGISPLPLSVNVSRYDIFRNDFYSTVTGLVEKYNIPVELLRLEITESAFAKSTEQITTVVRQLSDYGFTTVIDDFGSGYSSLNALKDVPADIIKLDMRFFTGDGISSRGEHILKAVVGMAAELKIQVVAEGVESREQADFMDSIGCGYVQGYLYAHPMPLEEYEKIV